MTPYSKGVMSCPICHKILRLTADYCPHCHAERHFGPLPREIFISCIVGFFLAPSVASLFIKPSLWIILIAIGGFCIGFIFAQFRFNTDRWVRSRTSITLQETDL